MNKATSALPVALAIVAAALGIYLFRSGERKVEPEPGLGSPQTVGEAFQSSGSEGFKQYATGTLAAMLVKPERKALPDLAFEDGSGQPLKLSNWRGRVVLVNLWATWCAPCRNEMPTLAALQRDLGSKDFEIVAISVDRKGVEASSAFLKETGADNLKLYVEPTATILNDLQALGLPATVLVDRQGKEIGRILGPAEWASPEAQALIRAALAEKS